MLQVTECKCVCKAKSCVLWEVSEPRVHHIGLVDSKQEAVCHRFCLLECINLYQPKLRIGTNLPFCVIHSIKKINPKTERTGNSNSRALTIEADATASTSVRAVEVFNYIQDLNLTPKLFLQNLTESDNDNIVTRRHYCRTLIGWKLTKRIVLGLRDLILTSVGAKLVIEYGTPFYWKR